MLQGKVVYGSWKDGSDIYKDSKGYFIIQYNPKKNTEFKKYIKGWKPEPNAPRLCLVNNKWKRCNTKKKTRKNRS